MFRVFVDACERFCGLLLFFLCFQDGDYYCGSLEFPGDLLESAGFLEFFSEIPGILAGEDHDDFCLSVLQGIVQRLFVALPFGIVPELLQHLVELSDQQGALFDRRFSRCAHDGLDPLEIRRERVVRRQTAHILPILPDAELAQIRDRHVEKRLELILPGA